MGRLLGVIPVLATVALVMPCGNSAADAAPEFIRASAFGGSDYDRASDLVVDKEGNTYITGLVVPPATFDGQIVMGATNSTPFLAKLNPEGRVQWVQLGAGGSAVALDPAGNIYAGGFFQGTIQLGETTLRSQGSSDLLLVKCNAKGGILWFKQMGGDERDSGGDLALDGAGNVYLTGEFIRHAIVGETRLESVSSGTFVAKFDASGKVLWTFQPTGSGVSDVSIAVDSIGNSFVVGSFLGEISFGTTTLQTDQGSYQGYLAKLDPDGRSLWAQKFRPNVRVALDRAGNPYLAGQYAGLATFGSLTQVNSIRGDVFVVKYTADGVPVWVTRAVGGDSDVVSGIVIDSDGNAYLTGWFHLQVTFGDITLTSNSLENDVFVAKCDRDGNFLWGAGGGNNVRRFGNYSKFGSSIALDAAGGLYVIGTTVGPAVFRQTTLPHFGGSDIFVAKLTSVPSPPQPVITSQPASQSAWAESTVHFGSFATGVAPLNFQWQCNGANLPRATNAWFSLTNITTAMAGNYSVIASNSAGSTTSSAATLTVNVVAPVITTQPASQTASEGRDVTFAATATGVPRPRFQWRKNRNEISGATNATLTLFNVKLADAAIYSVAASNQAGVVVSADAMLTVTPPAFAAPSFQWAKRIGSEDSGSSRGIALDFEGNVYVAGTFSGRTTFGNFTLSNEGGPGLFLVKYGRGGNELWARQAGGGNGVSAQAIAVDGAGNAYVTGNFFRHRNIRNSHGHQCGRS